MSLPPILAAHLVSRYSPDKDVKPQNSMRTMPGIKPVYFIAPGMAIKPAPMTVLARFAVLLNIDAVPFVSSGLCALMGALPSAGAAAMFGWVAAWCAPRSALSSAWWAMAGQGDAHKVTSMQKGRCSMRSLDARSGLR